MTTTETTEPAEPTDPTDPTAPAGTTASARPPRMGSRTFSVPDPGPIIRYYLDEEPLLQQVPTYLCARPKDLAYVLDHLSELVVKMVDQAGGYGMLMGPQATRAELDDYASRIRADPRKFIAQPRIELSTTPTWIGDRSRVEPRRVDLRPAGDPGDDL